MNSYFGQVISRHNSKTYQKGVCQHKESAMGVIFLINLMFSSSRFLSYGLVARSG